MKVLTLLAASAGLAASLVLCAAAAGQTPAVGQQGTATPADAIGRGQALFASRCQECHDPAVEDAPAKADLATFAPGFIVDTLKNGDMRPRAQGLGDDDINAIAAYLTAR